MLSTWGKKAIVSALLLLSTLHGSEFNNAVSLLINYFYCSSDFPVLKIQSWARFLCSSGSACLSFILHPPLVLSSSYSSKPSAWASAAPLILFVVSLLSLCCMLFFPCLFFTPSPSLFHRSLHRSFLQVFYFSLTAAGDLGDFPPHIPCSVAFHFILPLAQKVLPPAQPFEQPRTGSRHRGRLICLGNCCQLSCSTAADPHVAPLSSVFN